ncbi:MAG: DUF1573 domain-containing protein [Gemmataceae bacterium]
MTRIAWAVLGLFVFAGSAAAGNGDLFTEKAKDFGVAPRGAVLVHYFRFTNTTKETLTLGQPRVSCGCTSASVSTSTVAPGESAAVIAQMDTRRFGPSGFSKTVTVYVPFLSPNREEVSLKVTGIARDDLLMSPDTIAFGSVIKGKASTASTKVTFTSDAAWEIKACKSTGGYIDVEHKLESRVGNSVTYEIIAKLDKDCPAGNWTADLNLETSNAGVAKLRIPVTVNVTAPVAATPDNVKLGTVSVGDAKESRVTLQSGTPFKILDVKGADQVDVKVESREAKASHVITISAKPNLQGGFERNIEITTDNKEQPKVVIPISAKVVK